MKLPFRAERSAARNLLLVVAVLSCVFCVDRGTSAVFAQLPKPTDVVTPEAFVSVAPVPRGADFELAVIARIRAGFHVNSHQPSQEYLIPTTLTADAPAGIHAGEAVYPPGEIRKFKFSPAGLSVYAGDITLRMKLHAAPDAPLGSQKIPLTLRYQACNDEACLPPAKLPVTVSVEIAPAGAKAEPQHPEVFSRKTT